MLEKIMDVTNTICGLPLTIFIIIAGLYFSYLVGFFQITHIKKLWGTTFGKLFKKIKRGEKLKDDPSYRTIASVLVLVMLLVLLLLLQLVVLVHYSGCGL